MMAQWLDLSPGDIEEQGSRSYSDIHLIIYVP